MNENRKCYVKRLFNQEKGGCHYFVFPPFVSSSFALYVCSVQMFAIKFCLKFSLEFFLFHIYVLQCISVLELSQFAVF